MTRWALLLVALLPLPVAAQSYPSKPVRLVNPFTAGGPLDLMGRLLSDKLSGALGKPVLVENRPGAAGNVGAAEVARAPADGHTLLLTLFSIVTSNPHLYERLPFDPLKDFAPITAIARSDSVVVVHPSVPAASMRELVAHAKANPGRLNYASAGKASPGHLTAEFFARATGATFTHVPYKGNAEAIRSVIAGETQIMFTPTTGALSHIKAGKLKALAVYLTDAVDELPGVPSLEGFDQKTVPFWYGLLAPAGTPREIVQRLNSETVKALKDPQVDKALRAGRIFPIGNTPEEFGAMMREGHAAWGRVIRETGVRGE
ncbi:MAG TPA: tripartite tricarboxylate transporter substrate binding protein [Burkholderiales bacterium]|nr:tripartite tricarboxylate transporter substrate binding protein [Burkholderiales bacterium]